MYELPQVDSTGVHYGWLKYERLQSNLKEAFRVYHAECKANPPDLTAELKRGLSYVRHEQQSEKPKAPKKKRK